MRNAYKENREVVPAVARTADEKFTFQTGSIGGIFVIEVTAVTATPSVVFTIRGQATEAGETWDILASSAITATGTTVLKVHPSLTASANAVAKDILPGAIEIDANHADTDSITYKIQFIGVN